MPVHLLCFLLIAPTTPAHFHQTAAMVDEKMATETTAKKPEKKKSGGQPSASEESASPYPDMEFAQEIHQLTVKSVGIDAAFQQKVFKTIVEELENPSLYHLLETDLEVKAGLLSEDELKAMKEKHSKHVEELEAKVEEAKESAGDMEVMDARVKIARFAAKSLTKEEALEAYKKLLDLPKVSSGKKIDALMESSRVASFYGDNDKSLEFIESVSTTPLVQGLCKNCISHPMHSTIHMMSGSKISDGRGWR